jgi:hypothetical protein
MASGSDCGKKLIKIPSTVVKFVKQSTNNPKLKGSNTATDGLRQKVRKMKQRDACLQEVVVKIQL